ncbi:MAG TPA: TonB-dependent receptor [Steroidobacteraceae bacterium]|nr:TonB-dependent receptor [Steroidobacteraceae bacterium]
MKDLDRLSIEQLSQVEVTSVFKRPEPINRTPASVYVITQEEIRRSGAVTLPEALRLAPNLEVARLDAASYAVSARGFNTYQASNKLLVLIDGRSVYTPLHAGVYWDQQQLLLQDVERIEVISGPGGTLWGANAVNGVINIITRSAWHSEGGAASAQAGTSDSSISGRYSGRVGDSGAFRVYAMGFERGESKTGSGEGAHDDWDGVQGGFRSDWQSDADSLVVQGDVFRNSPQRGHIRGSNLLSRWTRHLQSASELEVQAYYDKVERNVDQVLDSLETFDLSLQHAFGWNSHQVVWGAGHRVTRDNFVNGLNMFVLEPESDTVQLSNAFVQDTIGIGAAKLTIGSKFEYSSYTGFEFLPSARLGWQASDTTLVWGAVSRAVRTPARLDRELTAPGLLDPANQFESETLLAYELGYRGQVATSASVSVSLFYNDYDDLRMLTITPQGRFQLANAMHGFTYGAEVWADWQVLDWWRLSPGFSLLQKHLQPDSNTFAPVLYQHAGDDPKHQIFLRSSMNLTPRVEFDVSLRAIGELPEPEVSSYVGLDARLGWHVSDHLDLALAGFNLLDDRHAETGTLAERKELRRSAYLRADWKF